MDNEVCYIIGKGPSLDGLTIEDFGPGPIIAINESIVKIESLGLTNPTYSLQQDGKSECMRRPQKATLLLSVNSAQWYSNYTPRQVYSFTELGLMPNIFSAITAIAFAKKIGCKKIVFMCFDACTCGDASYANTGVTYYDPNNSLGRFQRYCDIIKLSLAGMPAEWYKGNSIVTAPYTIITLTGDRQKLFRICRQYVARQTVLPSQWIVVDDGRLPLGWTAYGGSDYIRRQPCRSDPSHTICVNMLEALSRIKYPKVLIFEDDDWYHPQYAETILPYLDNYDLVGLGNIHYYHCAGQALAQFENNDHSCLAATAFTSKVVPVIEKLCQDTKSPLIDMQLWEKPISKHVIACPNILYIGLKGLPGRAGQTAGHSLSAHCYRENAVANQNKTWLAETIGDDIKSYASFKSYKVEIPFKGIAVRFSNDGSIYIPRRNKAFEEYMDKHFERVPNQLRWYYRVTNNVVLQTLKELFAHLTCHIVGKGPSLDNLKAEDFGPGPIIAINEAIHKVESLEIDNPIFMLQQDVKLKDTCAPRYGTVLVPITVAHIYHNHPSVCPFSLADLGLSTTPPTIITALEICRLLKVKQIKLYCFDAYTEQKTEYAKCVGYPAEKYGATDRFLHQTARINKHIQGLNTQFLTPTIPVRPFVDIPSL